jgi:hypothetical protein
MPPLEGDAVITSFLSSRGGAYLFRPPHRENPAAAVMTVHPNGKPSKRLVQFLLSSLVIGFLIIAQYTTPVVNLNLSRTDILPKQIPIVSIQHSDVLDKGGNDFRKQAEHNELEAEKGACRFQTLQAGELPGYTGWVRPANTLADSFQIRDCSTTTTHAIAGKNWTCTIHCSHEECVSGGSLFFTRAYGPSVIPGLVTDHRNGTYSITFMPLDPGKYTVEVVLTFSQHPTWNEKRDYIKPYEGYLLPGFPVPVTVLAGDHVVGASCPERETPPRLCGMSELVETGRISAVHTGRWRVTEQIMYRNYSSNVTQAEPANEQSYEAGVQSLGFTMDYFPTTCNILSIEDIGKVKESCFQRSRRNRNSTKPIQIVMIGDSNFRQQTTHLSQMFGGMGIHGISALGNFETSQVAILKELDELAVQAASDQLDYVVLFNIGLHEIMTCQGVPNCPNKYREHLTTLATAIQKIPALLKVWQTTPAAWPKVSYSARHCITTIND